MYTDVEKTSEAHANRALASAMILGFQSPSFTFGTDLILPVEANERLRQKLALIGLSQYGQGDQDKGRIPYSEIIQSILQLLPAGGKGNVNIYIPEVRTILVIFSFIDKRPTTPGLANSLSVILKQMFALGVVYIMNRSV